MNSISINLVDSYEPRKAGARQVLVASDRRLAWMMDYPEPHELQLSRLDTLIKTSKEKESP